jgi:hypothetical protein
MLSVMSTAASPVLAVASGVAAKESGATGDVHPHTNTRTATNSRAVGKATPLMGQGTYRVFS